MWWSPNVGWAGVADARGQSWLILGKFKIQINPINLTFPGGRKFMMQSYMQHPGRLESLYFCYLPEFQEDFESWHLNSQTKYPSASSMNLLAGIVALYVIDICQNCNPYFCSSVIDICQKCNSPESSATCGDAPYLQFYAFQITSQQMLIPKERK